MSAALESLNKFFKDRLELPDNAAFWLLDLFEVIQTFDDYADGEEVNRTRLDVLIYKTLVTMPSNPFYAANVYRLNPLVAMAILKWKASDTVERNNQANELSFSWRASYYDVVLAVVSIVHGAEMAMKISQDVLSLYGVKY